MESSAEYLSKPMVWHSRTEYFPASPTRSLCFLADNKVSDKSMIEAYLFGSQMASYELDWNSGHIYFNTMIVFGTWEYGNPNWGGRELKSISFQHRHGRVRALFNTVPALERTIK